MDHPGIWSDLSALAALVGVMAYALFGGADFGGGVWDLLAWGERKKQQRLAIQRAMGPVWEANHVWLILVVVVLFTCFPRGFSSLSIALFVPFHLALLGIMLRGASFVFRSHQSRQKDAAAETSAWGIVFGVASIISPILLGIAFGVITEGGIRVEEGGVALVRARSVAVALLPRQRPLGACPPAPILPPYTSRMKPKATCARIFDGGQSLPGRPRPYWQASCCCWPGSKRIGSSTGCSACERFPLFSLAWVVSRDPRGPSSRRHFALSRVFAAGEIGLLLLGWGLAQYPYLVYPDLPLASVAAPVATLRFMVLSLPVGAVFIVPSLWMLFRVFKSEH